MTKPCGRSTFGDHFHRKIGTIGWLMAIHDAFRANVHPEAGSSLARATDDPEDSSITVLALDGQSYRLPGFTVVVAAVFQAAQG
jgi:hypothetical protein